MKIKYYIGTAILATALFLIVNVPAATIVEALKDKIPQVRIQGVSGTLWQGSAQQVTIQSRHVFKNVDWSVCLSHLLMARACVELDATYKKNPLSGQLSVDMNKAIQAKNIKASISAHELSQMVNIPMGEFAGNIFLNLTTLNWQQGNVPSATGIIKWNKASVTVAETAQFGDITIVLTESETSPINANLSNKGGHLSISGLASVNTMTSYNLDLTLIPNKASKNLRKSLEQFATPQKNGSFTFNNDNLKQLGLM